MQSVFLGELQKAVSCGYEIVEIIETWHWTPENRTQTLSREFMKKAYIQKVEASGNVFILLTLAKHLSMYIFRMAETIYG